MVERLYPCPACGDAVSAEPRRSFDICLICSWEEDVVELAFRTCRGVLTTFPCSSHKGNLRSSGQETDEPTHI
jgi:hypothetical protein